MRTIEGVGLILFDQDGRILMFSTSEVTTDHSQVAGMLSVPIEPIADGESIETALVRLIVERVGCGKVKVPPTPYRVFTRKLSDAVTEKISLFTSKCDMSFVAEPRVQDIKFYGWMPPQAIMNLSAERIRPGIEPIIGSCFAC